MSTAKRWTVDSLNQSPHIRVRSTSETWPKASETAAMHTTSLAPGVVSEADRSKTLSQGQKP